MERILFIALFALLTVGISAQKAERKAVRTGNKAYKEQLYGNAEADYKKAMEVNAASKEASFNLANTYYKQQKWDEAIKEYQHYLTLENENPLKISAAWSNMGNTFLKKKANEKKQQPPHMVLPGQTPQQVADEQEGKKEDNLKLSMEAYKNALRYNPKDDETRYNLAVVQKMIKDQGSDGKGEDKDKNKDKKDENKDQNKEQNKDKNEDNKDNKDQKQQENQMSQDNIQQILKAIEQDEKGTQERVKKQKAQERKQKNQNNRKQGKDW